MTESIESLSFGCVPLRSIASFMSHSVPRAYSVITQRIKLEGGSVTVGNTGFHFDSNVIYYYKSILYITTGYYFYHLFHYINNRALSYNILIHKRLASLKIIRDHFHKHFNCFVYLMKIKFSPSSVLISTYYSGEFMSVIT